MHKKSHISEKFCSRDMGQSVLSQSAGFFTQPYLHKKSTEWPDFLHVDTSSHKLKVD